MEHREQVGALFRPLCVRQPVGVRSRMCKCARESEKAASRANMRAERFSVKARVAAKKERRGEGGRRSSTAHLWMKIS